MVDTDSAHIIIQMTSQQKSRALSSPRVLDLAVLMILSTKPKRVSTACGLVMYVDITCLSVPSRPIPPVIAIAMAMNGTAAIVQKKLNATAWKPIFCAENVLTVMMSTLRSFTSRARAFERLDTFSFHISSDI